MTAQMQFVPHCCVIIGDKTRGYLVPRGFCTNPIVYQHQDGKVYCEEHRKSVHDADLAWAQKVQNMTLPRKETEKLIEDWKKPRLPKLQDGSLHPMDHVKLMCAKQLENLLN